MPHSDVPSKFFFRNGHLNTNSQQAPHRLHSPRRKASEATVSCLRKLVFTKRLIFPCACRARSLASESFLDRTRCAKRSSKERCLFPIETVLSCFIYSIYCAVVESFMISSYNWTYF